MKERDKAKQIAEDQSEMWPTYRQEIRIAIQDYYSGIKEIKKDPKNLEDNKQNLR